jgi:hypothetical protein
MKFSRRVAWLLLFSGTALFLGFLFRDFLVANIFDPIGAMVLLVWRLMISVHQTFYWGAVVALAAGLAFRRLVQALDRAEMPSDPSINSPRRVVDSWRHPLVLAYSEDPTAAAVKRELRYMLVEMYAVKQTVSSSFEISEELRLRRLPLPDAIYSFLFSGEARNPNPSWKQRLRRLAAKPGQWLRQWRGCAKRDFIRDLDLTLSFMEAMMEVKHGDDSLGATDH